MYHPGIPPTMLGYVPPVYTTILYLPGYTPYIHPAMTVLVSGACSDAQV